MALLMVPLLCALLVTGASMESFAQDAQTGQVLGRVIDAQTGAPLADAIVFILNSSIGGSSSADGRFLLEHVPAGDCELVVSHIGYVRQILRIAVKDSSAPALVVKLNPRPVSLEGVEVEGQRGSRAPGTPLLFFPSPSSHSYSVYGLNAALPIGILFTDSALYMCALDTAIIDSEKYLRLWLLYKNLTDEPAEFNPMEAVRMRLVGNERTFADVRPVVAGEMMASVTKRMAMEQFSARIQATIDALLLIHKLIRPGYIRILGKNIDAREGTDADKSGRMRVNLELGKYPALKGTTTEYLAKVFRSSVHAGILMQYTVYPDNSVDGFVYFPFPGLHLDENGAKFNEALLYHYELEVTTASGRRTIVFTAN